MPRTDGVSSRVRMRRILPSPRPRRVAAWISGLRLALRIWRTVTVFPAFAFFSPMTFLSYLVSGFRGGLVFAAGQDFRHAAATALGHHTGALLVLQGIEGRAHHVVGIGGAQRLGDDIAHAQSLEHRAHRAARDDAGTGGSRTHQNLAGAVMAAHFVMNGAAFLQRDADQRLLGVVGGLADGFRHFARLAMAVADPAGAIAHHHQSGKAEAAATLHDLGDTVDVHQLVDQVAVLFLAVPAATAFTTATAFATSTITAAAIFALLFALLFGCHMCVL